ncbi:MAG TPA: hypothetical protein VFC01_32995 [Mycobacterium sp.]|nr:hypothetical protein [Mycobacterium sp.]
MPGEDDQLLTPSETASWLAVSPQWLSIGRHRGWGPPFERLTPKVVRYRRGSVRAWLAEREHRRTADYAASDSVSA